MLVNESVIPVPRIEEMGLPLPNSAWGESLELGSSEPTTFVFISNHTLIQGTGALADVYLYGAKFDMDGARINGSPRPEMAGSFFLQFYILLKDQQGGQRVWTLAQHASSTYSDCADTGDHICALDLEESDLVYANRPPIWKRSEAQWPTVDGKPMVFLDQTELKNTKVNSKFLTVGEVVFLFYSGASSTLRFKLVTQDKRFQTARAHYAAEAKRMKKPL